MLENIFPKSTLVGRTVSKKAFTEQLGRMAAEVQPRKKFELHRKILELKGKLKEYQTHGKA